MIQLTYASSFWKSMPCLVNPVSLSFNGSCSNSHILYVQIAFCSHKIYTHHISIPAYLLGNHVAYGYSNFPSINGLLGTWSLLTLSLLNMSADCINSSISIPISFFIASLPSLAPTSIICAFW